MCWIRQETTLFLSVLWIKNVLMVLIIYIMQSTHLDNFEGIIGDNIIRLNLLAHNKSQPSPLQGLVIYIENRKEGHALEEIFTIQNLPKEAETIFFDIPTLFDYIIEHHRDQKRVCIIQEGLLVCNIIKARGTQRRQEVILPMALKPLHQPPPGKVQQDFSELNSKIADLVAKTSELLKDREKMKQQVSQLSELNLAQRQQIKKCQQQNQSLQQEYEMQTQALKNEISSLKSLFSQQLTALREQLKYNLGIIQTLKQQLSSQKEQNDQFKQYIKSVLNKMPQIAEGIQPPFFQTHLLGQKVHISIDTGNQFISMFNISANKLERVKADLTRYQLLGNQIMGKASNTYYEVTINKLSSGNLLIGLTSLSRRGERHSHDHRECVCLQASGKIFEMGKKYPSVAKLQAGQTVRVHLDLDSSRARWLVGYTEVASVLLPDYLVHSKLVAYIELNEVGDSISLNQ